jgi:hypothetical protein
LSNYLHHACLPGRRDADSLLLHQRLQLLARIGPVERIGESLLAKGMVSINFFLNFSE